MEKIAAPSRVATSTPAAEFTALVPDEIRANTEESFTSLDAEALRRLATRDHARALDLALASTDLQRREELLQAVLRGWASVDPSAAADWARTQIFLEAGLAMAAVFNGANGAPEEAVRLYRRLSSDDSENIGSYANYLVYALGQVEKFELAATVAAEVVGEARIDVVTAAYHAWGEHQPKLALAAAAELKDPELRRAATEAVLGGWAKANPAELTEIAIDLPPGPDRQLAVVTALRRWIEQDPAAVAAWAARAKPFPEMEATLEE